MMGNKTVSERLNAKTLDQMFVNMVEQGYECPPFVSNAILETAKSVFVPDQSNRNQDALNVGQVMILGIATSEPAGKPFSTSERPHFRKKFIRTTPPPKKGEEK